MQKYSHRNKPVWNMLWKTAIVVVVIVSICFILKGVKDDLDLQLKSSHQQVSETSRKLSTLQNNISDAVLLLRDIQSKHTVSKTYDPTDSRALSTKCGPANPSNHIKFQLSFDMVCNLKIYERFQDSHTHIFRSMKVSIAYLLVFLTRSSLCACTT
jgi:hypothetical protein